MKNRLLRIIISLVLLALVIWIISYFVNRDNDSTITPNLSVSVYNQTQNVDATISTAHPKDVIVYTLTATNPEDETISGYVMETSLEGVTNTATLTDAQGANYNSGSNSLVWTPLDIEGNSSIQKQFTVRVKDTLAANAQDRTLTVNFGNQVVTNTEGSTAAVNPRPGNVGSGVTYKAPSTGIPGWVSFYLACFLTFGVLLFRTARKMGTPRN